ncbi:MAG: FAD/NAD(P)-binding protein [Coxiellaceae bacterium]|nr:FAD/NAD(P)-binding protein [Coxiellaceae bacterium]
MEKIFEWTVIGAGPAGIVSVAELFDQGIDADAIAWIDPAFKVGDLGTHWRYVSSNTPVESFTKVYSDFASFEYKPEDKKYFIDQLEANKRCPLMVAAQPLQDFTESFRKKISSYSDLAIKLAAVGDAWQVTMASGKSIKTKKVILALGAEARELPFSGLEVIPLTTAANPGLITKAITKDDVVAVYGAYQSARTVEENLAKTDAKKIYHFYRSKREFNGHIGSLDLDERVMPVEATADNMLKYMPQCNKVIYAVGFQRRHVSIDGLPEDYSYNYDTGRIAPGVYGIGLAFPEIMLHSHGRPEYKISAVRPFAKHLKEMFPQWQQEQPWQAVRQCEPMATA